MPLPTITTARTPRLDLPYLFPGQSQKEAFVNEALTRLDSLIQPAIAGEAAAPPAEPMLGDCFIVAGPATDAWAGREGMLATWAQTMWLFAQPPEGARVHDKATGALAVFTAADGWQRAAAPAAPTGGAVQDAEARAALAAIVTKLHALRIFSS